MEGQRTIEPEAVSKMSRGSAEVRPAIPGSAETALQQSEERLRLAIEAGRVGIWDWDIQAGTVTWFKGVSSAHKLVPESFSGQTEALKLLIHPDDRAEVERRVQQTLAGQGDFAAELRIVLPDGSIRWVNTRANLHRDAQGKPARMIGATQDTTERVALLQAERQAHADAEATRQRLEMLAFASNVLSGSLEPQQTLETIASLVVPSIADWCRLDLLNAAGVPQHALTYHSDPAKTAYCTALVNRLGDLSHVPGSVGWSIARGTPTLRHLQPEHFGRIPDAALAAELMTLNIHSMLSVPLVARGRSLGAITAMRSGSSPAFTEEDMPVISDLGQRAALALDNARLYADAERARQQAETASRTKDEFLAMLGHELRNPLAPIVTALHLMELRGESTTQPERKIISRQVAHLSRLVDDLLDVSRITQGKVDLKLEAVNMADVAEKAIEQVRPLLEKRRLHFKLSLSDEPVFVQADAVRLSQVLSNLLANAAKFTGAQGSVWLRIHATAEQVETIVEDSGIGIPAELLPKIFEPFVQGAQHSDRQEGGLGLGLAIANMLVQMHGGRITAESEGLGRGTTVRVQLPRTQPAADVAVTPPHAATSVGAARLLVVDDNVDAGETLAQLLSLEGHEVRFAADGPSALRLLGSYKPDLAILDIGLPAMDGYELARRLRANPALSELRLVALTGYGRDLDRAHATEAGFDRHLVKPIAPSELIAVLNGLLSRQ